MRHVFEANEANNKKIGEYIESLETTTGLKVNGDLDYDAFVQYLESVNLEPASEAKVECLKIALRLAETLGDLLFEIEMLRTV